MANFDEIRAVKARARARLLAIPGVHSVAIGGKKVGGKKTADLAIAVFVKRKKPASELRPGDVIPAEIEGVKTDVIEEPMPQLHATFPDVEQYDVLDGGIQIQAGTSVTGTGTLGCIAKTLDPEPKYVALTCHHVVALWSAADFELKGSVSGEMTHAYFWGKDVTGVRISVSVTLKPTGGGASTTVGPFTYVTTATDTPVTIATKVAGLITATANPNLSASAGTYAPSPTAGDLHVTPVGAFTAEMSCAVQPLWVTQTSITVVTFNGLVRPGFLAVARIYIGPLSSNPGQYVDALYTTAVGDDLHAIASKVAAEINALANPGLTATGPATPTGSEVTIAANAGFHVSFDEASIFSPMTNDKDAKLGAIVAPDTITLTGGVDGDDYGIYTNVDAGGTLRSFGTFLNPAKKQPLDQIARAIASGLAAESIPGVTVTASGAKITVTGAEIVQCYISSDIRIGQPVNNFGSSCSHCCSRRFGRVLDARLEIDTCAIQLDGGKQYVAEIKDIGLVTGSYAITGADVATPGVYKVKKRGCTSGITNGTADYLNAEGNIGDEVFHRYYTDAIKIAGNSFSIPGDSGSALLNSSNQVVGIVFGGSTIYGYATPIQTIEAALNVAIQSATITDPVTVPDASGAHAMSMLPEKAAPVPEFDWQRLHEAELELKATPEGGEIMTAVRRHIPETQDLILRNRRFAATWRRYGGPLIVQAVLRMAQRRDEHLPQTIKGRPLLACLKKIQEMLDKCASPELCRDLTHYQSRLEAAMTMTYAELVHSLQTAVQE